MAIAPVEVRSPQAGETVGAVIGEQSTGAIALPPSSVALATSVSQDLGLVALDNPRTSVSSRLVDGVREAIAVSTGTQLRVLGGMVTIEDPRWEAVARTGAIEQLEGRFTFSSAAIFGITRPPEQFVADFDGFSRGLSDLLGGLGVRLSYPKAMIDRGRVTVSPLTLEIVDAPIGRDLIRPLLSFLKDDKDAAVRELIAQDCLNQQVVQILDLILTALSGTGAISLRFGGAEAFSAGTEFPKPLELGPGAPAVDPQPAPLPPPSVAAPPADDVRVGRQAAAGGSIAVPGFASFPNAPGEAGPAGIDVGSPGPTVEPAVVLGATETDDESVADELALLLPPTNLMTKRFEAGPSRTGSIAVGAGGLLGLLLLAGADRRVMARRRIGTRHPAGPEGTPPLEPNRGHRADEN